MKKRFLSLLLLICIALGCLVGCVPGGNSSSSSSAQLPAKEDFAAKVTLDFDAETQTQEVTVKMFIDGDTTHFYVPKTIPHCDDDGVLKARYLAVNTPESTGTIEPWGKKASDFTKSKLQNAASIVIETDKSEWELDSTAERHLVWVWYKPQGADTYRNLNIELLQEGLALGSKASSLRYGTVCAQAINVATAHKMCVYSQEKDPDFYYGTAVELDLFELRTNIDKYVGKRVAFNATVAWRDGWTVYVEDFHEATNMVYGMTIFFGYNGALHEAMQVGNRLRIVGNLTDNENYGYQISSLSFDLMDTTNPENVHVLGKQTVTYRETAVSTLLGTVTLEVETVGDDGEPKLENKTFDYGELALSSAISLKGLRVTDVYTTKTGNNAGAISITCEDAQGNEITVRTVVLKHADGTNVLESEFVGKTIDVKGIIDQYDGEYQVKVFALSHITIY